MRLVTVSSVIKILAKGIDIVRKLFVHTFLTARRPMFTVFVFVSTTAAYSAIDHAATSAP